MSNECRYMRVFVLFDLPVDTAAHMKSYRIFRKSIIRLGFIMLQESVYTKLTMTVEEAHRVIDEVTSIAPECGTIHILKVTEKQFANMVDVNCSDPLEDYCTSVEDVIVL